MLGGVLGILLIEIRKAIFRRSCKRGPDSNTNLFFREIVVVAVDGLTWGRIVSQRFPPDAAGAKWFFTPTDRLWLAGELMRVNKSPYGAGFTPYTQGLTGWVPMVQAVIGF